MLTNVMFPSNCRISNDTVEGIKPDDKILVMHGARPMFELPIVPLYTLPDRLEIEFQQRTGQALPEVLKAGLIKVRGVLN